MPPRAYTRSERTQRAALVLRGGRHALAGADTAKYDRQIDRIDERAEDRWQREAEALHRQAEHAKDVLAAAKAAERAVDRKDRAAVKAARDARVRAQAALKRAENAERAARRTR